MSRCALYVCCSFLFALIAVAQIKPATDAPQPLSPAESAKTIQLPAGFRIDLVASEPLIQDPSCIAFDEAGRLFVCELHGYNVEGQLDVDELNKTGKLDTTVRRLRWEHMGGKIAEQAKLLQTGIVKLLVDSDNDGLMDDAIVWADDLKPCYGLVPARGGIIVVAAPDIVFLTDRDNDGRADHRETLFTGFEVRELERGINNPQWGPDNWIYVGSGNHAGTITGPHLKTPVRLGNQDFRMKPDGTAIEPVSGNVGTFGLAMNDIGDRFPCSGGQPAVYALPLPYRYLIRNPFVATPRTNYPAANYHRGFRISEPHPWRVRRRQDPEWVKFYGEHETNSNNFSGGCGGQIYLGDLFPAEYSGNFFYCEPSLNMVHRCLIERDGSGYSARRHSDEQESEFLAATDQWFRPMNLRIGPDGAFYVVDMYREIIEDYSAIPRFLQQQYGLTKGSERGRIWRLGRTADSSTDKNALLSAWPSKFPVNMSVAELVQAIDSKNVWWRTTVQRLLVERNDPASVELLTRKLAGTSENISKIHILHALDALQGLKSATVIDALQDEHYGVRIHALRLAGNRLSKHAVLNQVVAMIGDDDPSVRLQVAMTLGESNSSAATDALSKLAIQCGDERWMDAAILSSARDSASDILVAIIDSNDYHRAEKLLRPLAETVGGVRDPKQIAKVLGGLHRADEQVQTECLRGLADRLSEGAPILIEDSHVFIIAFLYSDSHSVQVAAIRIARSIGVDDKFLRPHFAAAAKITKQDSVPTENRQRALDILVHADFGLISATANELLDVRQPPVMHQAAITLLDKTSNPDVVNVLLSRWNQYAPTLKTRVLDACLNRQNRISILVAAIEDKIVSITELSAKQRQQLLAASDDQLRSRVAALLQQLESDPVSATNIAAYRDALANDRDALDGKAVFSKNCVDCHKLKDQGFDVGPKLGTVLAKPDDVLLVDILDPSSKIDSEFASYTIVTNSGKTHSGILASESATSVILRMAKGEEVTVLRRNIEEMRTSSASIMPSDFHKQITPEQMANLIAFIRREFRNSD
ncbi:MAG: HEAT repeat domain-containing protein [Planctomycetales bacterium]|nr:HEAT repeat domain-containing protein [Planctomycetales bacterium]